MEQVIQFSIFQFVLNRNAPLLHTPRSPTESGFKRSGQTSCLSAWNARVRSVLSGTLRGDDPAHWNQGLIGGESLCPALRREEKVVSGNSLARVQIFRRYPENPSHAPPPPFPLFFSSLAKVALVKMFPSSARTVAEAVFLP